MEGPIEAIQCDMLMSNFPSSLTKFRNNVHKMGDKIQT